ncbi:MAG: hypothetical protein E7609_05785 [Ruminococcaceae bacterium]|nr:hypothetical protein [Oscillospiraceae bacterium]
MKRAFCVLLSVLVLATLLFSLLCLRVARGEAFSASAEYCEGHALFSVSVVFPNKLPRMSDAMTILEEVLPPLLHAPPRILWSISEGLWQSARSAVKAELGGCKAFP